MHCPSPRFLHLLQTFFSLTSPHLIYFPAQLISFFFFFFLPGSLPTNYLIPARLFPSLPAKFEFTETPTEERLQTEFSDAWPWLALSRLRGSREFLLSAKVNGAWHSGIEWWGEWECWNRLQTDSSISPNPCLLKSIKSDVSGDGQNI